MPQLKQLPLADVSQLLVALAPQVSSIAPWQRWEVPWQRVPSWLVCTQPKFQGQNQCFFPIYYLNLCFYQSQVVESKISLRWWLPWFSLGLLGSDSVRGSSSDPATGPAEVISAGSGPATGDWNTNVPGWIIESLSSFCHLLFFVVFCPVLEVIHVEN